MWPLTPRNTISGRMICLLTFATMAITAMAVPAVRHSLLRTAGRALVLTDRKEPADIILIATDADGAGVLEAADLVREGVAARVALFSDPPDAIDREFVRRGVPYFNSATVSIQQLRALGITSIEEIPRPVSGTEDEGRVLPQWCSENGFHTIVFVSTADHSRRSHRVLDRAMRGHGIRVIVRPSRYSEFDPDTWWLTRGGIRIEIVESQKLLLDFLQHPLS
jgi:hypothetical protein